MSGSVNFKCEQPAIILVEKCNNYHMCQPHMLHPRMILIPKSATAKTVPVVCLHRPWRCVCLSIVLLTLQCGRLFHLLYNPQFKSKCQHMHAGVYKYLHANIAVCMEGLPPTTTRQGCLNKCHCQLLKIIELVIAEGQQEFQNVLVCDLHWLYIIR